MACIFSTRSLRFMPISTLFWIGIITWFSMYSARLSQKKRKENRVFSMAIENTRFSFRFFWDRRALYIENQVMMPIQNSVEMGMNLSDLVEKIQAIEYYPALFEKAFGTPEVNTDRISIALGMFVQSMTSYRSKYDAGMSNGFADFSTLEMDGKNLFFSGTINCNHCHTTQN